MRSFSVLDKLRFLLHRGDTEVLLWILLIASFLLLLAAFLSQGVRLRRLNRRIDALTRSKEGQDLEGTLVAHMDQVHETLGRMESLEQAVGVLQAQLPFCLQRVNVVRFDAFDDVGGEQSFAVALLDGQGNGVILSSLYSRQDVRMYAKPVQEGQSSHALSHEEQRALTQR